MTQSERPASPSEARAQEELRTIAEELKGIETRLRAVHQSVAAPAEAEATQDADDEMDLATEIRTVIDCVLADNLEPAIRDLQAASALRISGR
jgi:hypothetical protein